MSGRDDWQTPPLILDRVRQIGPIYYDPCTTASNPVGAEVFDTKETEGLRDSAPWDRLVFVNPPFTTGAIQRWVDRIVYAWVADIDGALEMVVLTPFDTTKWRRKLGRWCSARAVLYKRLNYINPDTGRVVSGVRFSSELHYLGDRPYLFAHVFSDIAEIQFPNGLRP